MVQFRAVRQSVANMRVAIAALAERVSAGASVSSELAEWTAQQRVKRGSKPPPALVSSSAPATALAAWRAEQERRFGSRCE